MMDAYERTGKIGNTRPRNKAHALQIANAAAYTSARTPKRKKNPANNLKPKGTAMERFAISRGAKRPKNRKKKK